MKILLVDFDNAVGHVRINSKIIEALLPWCEITLLTTKLYKKSIVSDEVENKIKLLYLDMPDLRVGKISSFKRRLMYLKVAPKIIKEANKDYNIVFFIGYDLVTFSMLSHFLKKKKNVWAAAHNHIIFSRSKYRKLFFQILHPLISLVGNEKHIVAFIKNSLKRRSVYSPLTYFETNKSASKQKINKVREYYLGNKFKNLIFAPSGSNEPETLKLLDNCLSNDDLVLCKKAPLSAVGNFIEMPYFENYDELISACDIVFVGAQFENSVSGVALEGMGAGKPVLMPYCSMFKDFKTIYPSLIHALEENERLPISFKVNTDEVGKFREDHSTKMRMKCLKEAFTLDLE